MNRTFAVLISLLAAAPLCVAVGQGAPAAGVNDKRPSQADRLSLAPVAEAFQPLRLGEVRPDGWLRAQLLRDLVSGYHGHLDELLPVLRPEQNDFVSRAENKDCRLDEHGRSIPPAPERWWHAEMIGDWHDGLIRAAFLVDEPKTREKAEQYVKAMLRSQDSDGYIGIYPAGHRFHFHGPEGELWSQRCAILGLLAYYEFTGRKDVLDAVERAVKLTIRQFGPGSSYFDNPDEDCGMSHGLMFLDVLEWLFRLTGDEEYRRAALSLYRDYDASKVVQNRDAQLVRLSDPAIPLSGHGPDVMGFLRVPLWCYYLTGDRKYREAWQNGIRKTERHLGVGGSPLSGQEEEIQKEPQKPDLPYEYCSTFYLLHSLTWAIQKTGEAKYGDMFERALLNAAEGARFANDKALIYYSADERLWVRLKPPEGPGNVRFMYTAAFYPCCCHNSGARVLPYTISSLWMRSRDRERKTDAEGLVATLYGPSRVTTKINDVPVSVVEKTGYPFSYNIELTVTPQRDVRFPLRLRIPAWSADPVVTAGGATVTRDPRGYLVLDKKWSPGDTVHLKLRPAIQAQKAAGGLTAVSYGPLVFSLPIPEKAEIVQRFPEAEAAGMRGFFGYQFDPADLAAAKRPLTLRADRPSFGLTVTEDKGSDPQYPWDRSPLSLHGELIGAGGKAENVTLLPMGCTILRRTFFPTLKDNNHQ
jgi:uncharacterized protein